MVERTIIGMILVFCMNVLIIGFHSGAALSGTLPAAGSSLPDFLLQTPSSEQDRDYLGIENTETFSIDQIKCKVLMLEIIGVYCPLCHIQLPRNKTLFYRIKKDALISGKIKILAIAIGATPNEVAYLKEQFNIPYPVVTDPNFKIHKLIGEPRTPFTMLITGGSKVVFTHLGTIEDMDKFYLEIKKFIP